MKEYSNYIKEFKQSIQSQISEFVFKTNSFVTEIQDKQTHFTTLQNEIEDKQSETEVISYFKKCYPNFGEETLKAKRSNNK